MGNLWSILSALEYLGVDAVLVNQATKIINLDHIILPGVGSFRLAMNIIRRKNFDSAIKEAVLIRGSKILGICLGMQLLGSSSTEDGETSGLGLIPNKVEKFSKSEVGNRKIPHVGFNSISIDKESSFFSDLSNNSDFYFVHSYRMLSEKLNSGIAICTYGIEFLAAFKYNNIYGTQFHPEKSQTNGLVILRNFIRE